MATIGLRQVHLDFHTSEHIPDVGKYFDKKEWQNALKIGHVDSITVFAKCHHSWSYYPTKIGEKHPSLQRNLLDEQIRACKEIGVRTPIYYPVGWSCNDAENNPQWCVRNKDGEIEVTDYDLNAKPSDPRPIVSWKFLCPCGEYLDLILKQTREICELFPVDGFFYDITYGPVCYCETCRTEMIKAGKNPNNPEDAREHNHFKWMRLKKECNEIIQRFHPNATIFYNGMAGLYQPADVYRGMTHLELEDLPTTWGGYDKFPLFARYFGEEGMEYVAMSGKFHTMWGEFGGFKHSDAILYEASAMTAYGARCSFGDQLHPSGKIDIETYRNIGYAYEYIKKIAPYALDGQAVSRLGVWLSGTLDSVKGGVDPNDHGVIKMLLESQEHFRIVKPRQDDLFEYDVIILSGNVKLDSDQTQKLQDFVKMGRGLVLLGKSGLDWQGGKFVIDCGAQYIGEPEFKIDYTLAESKIAKNIVSSNFLNYSAGQRIKPTDGEVLGWISEPYFDRTYGKYCSHQNTPYRLAKSRYPAVIKKNNVIYFAHSLGEIYNRYGARIHRDLFHNALKLVYSRPVLQVNMPSAGRASIIHQSGKKRYVVHLLYGPPLNRGNCMVIEDIVALYDIRMELNVEQKIKAVRLAPSGQSIELDRTGKIVKTVVPMVKCHQAVCFEY